MKLIECEGIIYDLDCPTDRPRVKTPCGVYAGLVRPPPEAGER